MALDWRQARSRASNQLTARLSTALTTAAAAAAAAADLGPHCRWSARRLGVARAKVKNSPRKSAAAAAAAAAATSEVAASRCSEKILCRTN